MQNQKSVNEYVAYLAILFYTVIWKEQVVLVVGAASRRDHFISRLESAPTVSFLW